MIIESVMNLVTMQSAGIFGGGDFQTILSQLESMGFFSYLLPFLLIFALVFGILTRMNIFSSRGANNVVEPNMGVNAIISVAIAFLSLQFNFVSLFFAQIFPRLGVGLAIVLVLIILVGLFIPAGNTSLTNWITYLIFGIAGVVFLVVISGSFGYLGWESGTWFDQYKSAIFTILIFGVGIGVVIAASRPPAAHPIHSLLTRALGE